MAAATDFIVADSVVNDLWQNLVSPTIIDQSITQYQFQRYTDTQGSAGLNNASELVFTIKGNSFYMVPAHGYLLITFRLLQANRNPIVGEGIDKVTPTYSTVVDNPLFMFRDVTLEIGGTLIESHTTPGLRAQVKYLMETPYECLDTVASEGFIPTGGDKQAYIVIPATDDDPASIADFSPVVPVLRFEDGDDVTIVRNVAFDKGLERRARSTLNSKFVQYAVPLKRFFSFFEERPIPLKDVEITMRFKLDPGFENFILAPEVRTLELHKFELWIPRVRPSSSVELRLNEMMTQNWFNSVMYNHQRLYQRTGVAQGSTSYDWDIVTSEQGSIPMGVDVFMVPTSAMTGNQLQKITANPALFNGVHEVAGPEKELNIRYRRAYINVDSQRFPEHEYQIRMGRTNTVFDISRAYSDFLFAQNSANYKPQSGGIVSLQDWQDKWPILHFDLSALDGENISRAVGQTLSLHLEFEDLPYEYNIYALVTAQRPLAINLSQDKRIYVDFKR